MVFSSNVFLFLFLPIFLGLYYLSGQRYRNLLLLIASYVFYAWWRVDFLALFAAVTLWNYWIGLKVGAAGVRTKPAQRWLLLGVAVDLCILGYFKYANFGVDSINVMMKSAGLEPFILTHVLLPIGISFYIFESISYIIDVYRGDTPATRNLIDFAAFVAIFPHLIAGPVLRFRDLADQFNNRTHTLDKFSEGCTRFMQGFIKKVFIADTLAVVADHCFALQNPTTGDAWLGALAYTAQLYFDFSGYSDMAIGLGLMMGFRFMENFKQPYISQSITEFWRRWHISLSTWLRDYLYITLGGNRKGTLTTYRNLFLTMLLGGLWHGANITYIVWGAWHGMWLAIEKAIGLNTSPRSFNPIRWALHLPAGGDGLGDLPLRKPARRRAHVRRDVQLWRMVAVGTQPRQPHRPASGDPGGGLRNVGVLWPARLLQQPPCRENQGGRPEPDQGRTGRRPGQHPPARFHRGQRRRRATGLLDR